MTTHHSPAGCLGPVAKESQMLARDRFAAVQATPGFTVLSRRRWCATTHTGNTRRRRRHLSISAGTRKFVTRKKAHRPGIHRMLAPGVPNSRPEWGRLHRDPAARPDVSKEQVETGGMRSWAGQSAFSAARASVPPGGCAFRPAATDN